MVRGPASQQEATAMDERASFIWVPEMTLNSNIWLKAPKKEERTSGKKTPNPLLFLEMVPARVCTHTNTHTRERGEGERERERGKGREMRKREGKKEKDMRERKREMRKREKMREMREKDERERKSKIREREGER